MTLVSYTLIPLSAGMFPHIFMHWLTARRARSFRTTVIFYPLCVAIVWAPTVLLGVLGQPDFPGLQPAASSSILVRLITFHAPDLLAGLLGVGVLAAVMSSLDSQVLAIGTMFTQDIVRHHGLHDQMSERLQVLVGRLFVVAVLASSFALSLALDRSIFSIGVWSFTGFASLVPVAVAALFWKRSTRHGALASVCTVVLFWLYFFVGGWKTPDYTVGGTGIMPVAVILLSGTVVLVVVSMLTSAPSEEVLSRFFPRPDSDQK
jgi:SSS family solute:Na+ symporter